MHALKLQVSDSVYDTLMRYLGNYQVSDVRILNDDYQSFPDREHLDEEYMKLKKGESEFVTMSELDCAVEKIISKHES